MSFRIDQLAVLNLATVGNSITAGSFVKSGGTSSQFLKADGTVDTNAYITGITSTMVTTALGYTPVPNTRNITINGVTQDLSVDRTWTISAGVASVSGSGAGISVSPTTGAVVVSNTGVTSNVAGTGISVSGATGAVTITNTGVTSIVAGTAITISGATGAVTINNAGVTSLNGSTGALTGFATQAWVTSQGYVTGGPYLPLSGGTVTGVVTINGGGSQPLTLTTSSNGPWALNLFRSDLSSSSRVFNNGGFWYFEHRPQFNGNVALDAANYNSYAPTLTGGGASGTWSINITGNAGYASSAGNADTVDNFHASQSTVANNIVVRDANGYIFGNYINMTDDGNPGGGTAITSFITKQGDNYYRSVSPTNAMVSIRGVASGSWGINITGTAGSASSVAWTGVTSGYRTNYDLGFEPADNSSSYAGFKFKTPGGTDGNAGYFLIRGGSDSDVYTQNGITLVADAGWLTLAQRTTSDKGVRIMTGSGSTTRMAFYANGTTYLYTDLYLGSTNTRITASDATGYLRIYGSSSNYLAIGPYNNNGWVYFENISNTSGMYFNSPGRYAFDSVDLTPYTDAENSLGNGSFRWSQVYTSGWLRQYGAQGMYNQDYGTHFYSNGGSSWGITGSGGNVELQFRSNHQSTIRGYVYADTGNNIGFLNNGGSWSLRTDSSRNTILYGQLTVGQDIGYSSIYMYDSDEGTREIHCNSNRIGFLTQAGSWGAYLDDGTNWYSEGNIYAVAATARIQAGNSSSNDILYDSSRSALVARGNYPHVEIFAEVSNNNHGGTLRYTGYDNGSSGAYKSWNIGTAGSDLYFLDIGYGGTSNSNPHAGIAGLGSAYGYPNAFTAMRFHNNGNVGIGNFGTYGSLGTNTPAYKLDVRGTIYSNTDMRAPIFYDSDNTAYYANFADTGTSINIAGSINAATYNKPGLLLNASGTGSSGAAFGMQQVTAEGWTGIFVDYEPFTGWGLYHDNPANYFLITSETSTGSFGGGFTVPSRVSGNRTAYVKHRLDQNNGDFIAGGNIYMTGGTLVATQSWVSSQGYVTGGPFLPLSGGTLTGTLGLPNNALISVNNEPDIWGARFRTTTSTTNLGGQLKNIIWCGGGSLEGLAVTGSGTGGAAFEVRNDGVVWAKADMRAPIFYDSANTAYFCDPAGTSNLVAITTGATGVYNTFNSWTNLNGYHGFYSSVHNGAHFYPNDGSYGSWRISGSRNGWGGIEFANGGNGAVTLMNNNDSNTSGFHNNSYGWQIRWYNGTLYIGKNSYGGNEATVLDSSNYTSYAAQVNGNVSNTFNVFQLSYAATNFNPSAGPRSLMNSMSVKMWNNYFNGTGLGSDYGTVMQYYSLSGHVDTQVYFDANGETWYRSAAYAAGWQSWKRYMTDSNSPYAWNMNQYVRTSDAPTFNGVYTNDWFRANGCTGLYFQSYAVGLRAPACEGASYGNACTYGTGSNGYNGWMVKDPGNWIQGYMWSSSGNGGSYGQTRGDWHWYWSQGNSCMGISSSTTSSSYALYVNNKGIYTVGDVVAYSDRRKKTDIVTIDNALEKVTNLRGVFYTKIGEEEKGRKTGVIAQEINEVLPEVVTYAADVDEYGVSYGNIAGVLIEAIKEQNELIKTLKSEIDELKAKLN